MSSNQQNQHDVTVSYGFKFRALSSSSAKKYCQGFRSWLAYTARRLADAIDGLESITIEITSTPQIPKSEQIDVINCGLEHSRNLFVELVRQEALSESMREFCPELYVGDDQ
jgi:hypothetical protein